MPFALFNEKKAYLFWMTSSPVEVMVQQDLELLPLVDVGAGGDQVASGEPLVEGGVVPAVQLVDGHLPDRVGARRAVVGVAVALVGHPGHGGGGKETKAKTHSDFKTQELNYCMRTNRWYSFQRSATLCFPERSNLSSHVSVQK